MAPAGGPVGTGEPFDVRLWYFAWSRQRCAPRSSEHCSASPGSLR